MRTRMPVMLLLLFLSTFGVTMNTAAKKPIAIVIHGGAGTILKENLDPEKEKAIRATLAQATNTGYAVLQRGGKATEAVIAAIKVMEDSPLFNAGKGAVFTAEGTHELDASIMRGNDLQAGAVAAVRHVKNPITAAMAVLEKSPHVMLSGNGADQFAKEHGLDWVENRWFDTEFRHQQWQKARSQQKTALSEDDMKHPGEADDFKFGTVGAVALDIQGNLAAGTSTGGMTNKSHGRIGDSPIIGAGTYADNRSCAISATGHGEYFIRYAVAHDICARSRYQNLSLQKAAETVIMDVLFSAGGEGGIIGLDRNARPVMVFNSKGMYRAWRTSNDSAPMVGLYDQGSEQPWQD